MSDFARFTEMEFLAMHHGLPKRRSRNDDSPHLAGSLQPTNAEATTAVVQTTCFMTTAKARIFATCASGKDGIGMIQ